MLCGGTLAASCRAATWRVWERGGKGVSCNRVLRRKTATYHNPMKTNIPTLNASVQFSLVRSASRSLIAAFIAALIALCPGKTRADTIALNFNLGGTNFNTGAGTDTLGWAFSLSAPISLTQLGFWDNGNDGLIQAHKVTIWDSTGTVIEAQATVPNGTAATLTNGFRYVTLGSSVMLPAGNYVIGAFFGAFGDEAASQASAIGTNSPVTYLGSRAIAGDAFPSSDAFSLPNSYFGPNFQFTSQRSVPDTGSTLGLLALALAGLFGARRIRSIRLA